MQMPSSPVTQTQGGIDAIEAVFSVESQRNESKVGVK